MKEILFRGKCPIIDEQNNYIRDIWVFGDLICRKIYEKEANTFYYSFKTQYIIREQNSGDEPAPEYPVKDYTIGQYTGIKDIHGNKIFEGDVVRSSNFVQGIVVYLEAVGAYIVSTEPPEFITVDENWNSFDCDWIFICDCRDLEVVGNYADGVFIHPKTNIEDISDSDSKGITFNIPIEKVNKDVLDILVEEDSDENNS